MDRSEIMQNMIVLIVELSTISKHSHIEKVLPCLAVISKNIAVS